MRINGANEFLSRTASLNRSVSVQNSSVPALTPQRQAFHDSLFLSNIGKRLSLSVNKAPLLQGKQKADMSNLQKADIRDPLLRLAKFSRKCMN